MILVQSAGQRGEAGVGSGLPFTQAWLEVILPRCVAVELNNDKLGIEVHVRGAHWDDPLVVVLIPYYLDVVSFSDRILVPLTVAFGVCFF
jgi:hypothetical protein